MSEATGQRPNRATILLLGASVRAAAQSARRAQLDAVGIDLFADRDLAAMGPAYRVAPGDYPRGLARKAAALADGPWMYTGAIENHPELIDDIARERPLWGNRGEVVRAVRDPFAVAEVFSRAGLPHPAVRGTPRGLPRDGSWLIKPLASAGGSGIVPLQAGHESIGRACYYQERIDGVPLGAVFVGASGCATLAGVSWQWVGRPGAPLGYRGSIGPWPLTDVERRRVAELGTVLASHFGLGGLFGVDLIVQQGWPWPVEVNPRYTASVEVLELALGRSLLAKHRAVFDADGEGSADSLVSTEPSVPVPLAACPPVSAGSMDAPSSDPGLPLRNRTGGQAARGTQASGSQVADPNQPSAQRAPVNIVGKVILFAQAPCVFSLDLRLRPSDNPFQFPRLADLPEPGAPFLPGEPVMTLFDSAPDVATCRARLQRALARWSSRLQACRIS